MTRVMRKPKPANINAMAAAAHRAECGLNAAVTRVTPAPALAEAGLDLKLGMDDLRAVAVSGWREKLLIARNRAEQALKAAREAYAAQEEAIRRAAQAFIGGYVFSPEAQALAAALSRWTGKTWTPRLQKQSYSYYSYRSDEENDPAPAVDLGRQMIVGEIAFRRSDVVNETIDELDQPVEIPFNEELKALVEAQAAAKAAVDQATADLSQVNRLIADLPSRGEQLRAALVTAHLEGRLTGREAVLDLLTRQLQPSAALPERVRGLLENAS